MNTYLATLKNGVKYNKMLKNQLKENKINVVKYLKTVQVLILESEEEVIKENFDGFEALEKERKDFTL